MTTTATPATHDLMHVRGAVHRPGDSGWDDARRAWNLSVDQHPELVVEPVDAGDVAATLRFAAGAGLRVAVQGTGHGAAARGGDLAGALLLRTSAMRGVTIDAQRRTARAEAGSLWLEVAQAAAPHGLVALHGSAPDVGVVGYTLGGGLGWLARRHGLACSHVSAIEVVLPDGRRVRTTATDEPRLFWALRGGGGSFGVVTAIEFALFAVEEVTAGALMWPIERAPAVLRRWRDLCPQLPRDITTVGRILRFPPLDEVPAPVRGRAMVLVEVASLLGEEETEAHLAPLRELGPELDTVATGDPSVLLHLHGDPEGPVPGIGAGQVLADLPDGGIDAITSRLGAGADTALVGLELRQLGGALATPTEGAGALGAIPGAFAAYAIGVPGGGVGAEWISAELDAVMGALSAWSTGRPYLNFAEAPVRPEQAFGRTAVGTLWEIADAVDPGRVLMPSHDVRR
ncbi:MAG: FAD-binding oxidoreductase [Solirubrobacteraceae bacterium]|nr:FAD-binding oxidoreductase [Solirubrobacteraceae bacterium]